jgi:hypothetical protein
LIRPTLLLRLKNLLVMVCFSLDDVVFNKDGASLLLLNFSYSGTGQASEVASKEASKQAQIQKVSN